MTPDTIETIAQDDAQERAYLAALSYAKDRPGDLPLAPIGRWPEHRFRPSPMRASASHRIGGL